MSRPANLPLRLLLLYALFIIYATTIPFAFSASLEYASEKFWAFVADPLQLKMTRGLVLTDLASNALLFVPLGFLVLILESHSSRAVPRMRAVSLALLAGFILSSCVEFLQLFSKTRTTSLLDIAADAAGTMIGAGLALRYEAYFRQHILAYLQRQRANSPQLALFYVYAGLLLLSQLIPFDLTLDFSMLKKSVKSIDFYLPQTATDLGELFTEAILYTAFGFLWLRAQKDNAETRTIVQALGLTAGAALVIECAQVFLISHTAAARNLLAGLEGGLYGAVLHIVIARRTRHFHISARAERARKLTLDLAAAHGLAYFFLVELQPYEFDFARESIARKLHQFNWLPFIEYFSRTTTKAVLDLSESLVCFAVLTLLLCARRRPFPRNIKSSEVSVAFASALGLSALGLSALIEFIQLGLPNRAPGVTDCVNSLLGVGLGLWLWRYSAKLRQPSFRISAQRVRRRPQI